jgi:hypothetical protein
MKCPNANMVLKARALIRDCNNGEHLQGVQNFIIIVSRRLAMHQRLEAKLWRRYQEKANSLGRSAFSLEPLGVA